MGLPKREKERDGYNKFNVQTVECKICGKPTTMLGTQLCDRCWELKTRMERDVALSLKILVLISKERYSDL